MFGKRRGIIGTVLLNLFWISAFVIAVYLLNVLIPVFDSSIYSSFVYFLNSNAVYAILLIVVSFMGDLVYLFAFPFDVLSPIFKAVSGLMLAVLFFRTALFIDSLLKTEIYSFLLPYKNAIYIAVAAVILIAGLISVYIKRKREAKARESAIKENKAYDKGVIEWNDIGGKIKLAFYNFFSRIANFLKGKKKDRKKR